MAAFREMPARAVSVSMASATALGLVIAGGLAPPAAAEPCSGPAANAAPPPGTPVLNPPSGSGQLPTGRKPRGANDQAPLPKLGPLLKVLMDPNTYRQSAPVQQQAAVIPVPPPAPGGVGPSPNAAQIAPNAAPAPPPAVDPGAAIAASTTSLAEWVSGPDSPNQTLDRFGVSGADLGIPWDNGDPANHQVLMAFGDTYGYCGVQGHQWRYNTLFRSQDRDLNNGISVAPGVVNDRYSGSPLLAPSLSKQIINTIKKAPSETGIIPTAGIAIGRIQFINFMSIKSWGNNGEWSTNYSGIARSIDNGQTWGVYPGTIRPPGGGNENFQMGAFTRPGDGYVYSFGTPAGRDGSAYLARVPEGFVPDLAKYQYWHGDAGGSWVPANPAAATPVVPGPVSEMSAQYNNYLKQYLMLYCNGANDVVARTAPSPQGPWSPEHVLVSSMQMPGGIYAPYIHPWSSGKDLYFTLSLWSAYNVMLMHTVLG